MIIIRRLLFAWIFVASLPLAGFGQDQILRNPLWSDFTYNSPEEKEYWDKLPEWKSDQKEDLEDFWMMVSSHGKLNSLGELIDSNSSEGYNGYVKNSTANNRTIEHYIDGYLVRRKSWYMNGREMADENYKGGSNIRPTRDGIQITWDENGQKKVEKNCKDGKPDGSWTEWYENGHMKVEKNYRVGKPDGSWTEWYENGQMKVSENYEVGKLDGLQTTWHKNGQKESIVSFKDGYEDGRPFYRWDENGLQEYSPFGRTLTNPTSHR